MGWAHCGVEVPGGNRVPVGTRNMCKSKNLCTYYTSNFSAGGLLLKRTRRIVYCNITGNY